MGLNSQNDGQIEIFFMLLGTLNSSNRFCSGLIEKIILKFASSTLKVWYVTESMGTKHLDSAYWSFYAVRHIQNLGFFKMYWLKSWQNCFSDCCATLMHCCSHSIFSCCWNSLLLTSQRCSASWLVHFKLLRTNFLHIIFSWTRNFEVDGYHLSWSALIPSCLML